MAGNPGSNKRYLGIGVAVIGVVANVVGIVGAVADWGSTTTTVVLGATQPAGASESTTSGPLASPSSLVPATTTTTTPAETPADFLTALGGALASGDVDYLVARLHPEVIARYGEAQCRTAVTTYQDPSAAFEVVSIGALADYTWVTDNVTTVIPATLSVDVLRTIDGAQTSVTVHVTEVDGTFRWYSDCGTPA